MGAGAVPLMKALYIGVLILFKTDAGELVQSHYIPQSETYGMGVLAVLAVFPFTFSCPCVLASKLLVIQPCCHQVQWTTAAAAALAAAA